MGLAQNEMRDYDYRPENHRYTVNAECRRLVPTFLSRRGTVITQTGVMVDEVGVNRPFDDRECDYLLGQAVEIDGELRLVVWVWWSDSDPAKIQLGTRYLTRDKAH